MSGKEVKEHLFSFLVRPAECASRVCVQTRWVKDLVSSISVPPYPSLMKFGEPILDSAGFPQSEEWKEGAGDLEHQLLVDPTTKQNEAQGLLLSRRRRSLLYWGGWLTLFGIVLIVCGWLFLFHYYTATIGGDEDVYYHQHGGLYEQRTLKMFTFTAPNMIPSDIGAWQERDYRSEYDRFRELYRNRPVPIGGGDNNEKGLLSETDDKDEAERYEWFKKNLKMIHDHNKQKGISYLMAPNQFSDLSPEEWRRRFVKSDVRLPEREKEGRLMWNLGMVSNSSIPVSVDWHERGCVTPVKDQSKCGSCWAFSSTGAIEGAVCAQTGRLVSLSEQQLIDCSSAEGTHGCNGGFMDNAFQYVMDVGGICSEDEYPYHARQEVCRKSCHNVAKISGIADVPPGDIKALQAAVAIHGPVAAGVQADKPAFQFYHSGILSASCGKHLNHAILITGYGADPEPYWLVKNSWGATWGDKGYIKLAMEHHGKAGECGILLAPSIPIVKKEDIDLRKSHGRWFHKSYPTS